MSIPEASPSQRRRIAQAERHLGAGRVVASRILNGDGDVAVAVHVLTADSSRLAEVEVIDRLGRPYAPDRAEALLGNARDRAIAEAERCTADAVALIAIRLKDGERVNLAAAARRAGLGRNTLYTRLRDDHGIDR